jgi:hypothetical protein
MPSDLMFEDKEDGQSPEPVDYLVEGLYTKDIWLNPQELGLFFKGPLNRFHKNTLLSTGRGKSEERF